MLSIIALLIFAYYSHFTSQDALAIAFKQPNQETSEKSTSFLPTVTSVNRPTPVPPTAQVPWSKPANQRVLGLIFYGRRKRVEILKCYLERNLVDQGGWLDEVHFIRNTKDVEDLEFLESIVAANSHFKIVDLPEEDDGEDRYALSWKTMERDAVYIKIDDDVV